MTQIEGLSRARIFFHIPEFLRTMRTLLYTPENDCAPCSALSESYIEVSAYMNTAKTVCGLQSNTLSMVIKLFY